MTRSLSGLDPRRPRWEPEPLHLPTELPRRRDEQDADRDVDDEERDLPGSHVTVIELS